MCIQIVLEAPIALALRPLPTGTKGWHQRRRAAKAPARSRIPAWPPDADAGQWGGRGRKALPVAPRAAQPGAGGWGGHAAPLPRVAPVPLLDAGTPVCLLCVRVRHLDLGRLVALGQLEWQSKRANPHPIQNVPRGVSCAHH